MFVDRYHRYAAAATAAAAVLRKTKNFDPPCEWHTHYTHISGDQNGRSGTHRHGHMYTRTEFSNVPNVSNPRKRQKVTVN